MEELSYHEKLAVVKVLTELMYADHVIDENEVAYLDELTSSFALNDNYKSEMQSVTLPHALASIRELDVAQKEMVAKMMGNMIVCDKDINYDEVRLYNAFCNACDINGHFNMEDYPGLSLSGPFVNPEDLMENM